MEVAANLTPLVRAGRATAVLLGVVVIALALVTHLWALDLTQTFAWLERAFGPVFLGLYLALVAVALLGALRLAEPERGAVWYEAGVQAAGGIATLALTFTLLGISLGIESLSAQTLTPDTVEAVIADLTRHFSTAFMTTVIGLPTANLLRAVLAVRRTAALTTLQTQEAS